MIKTCSQDNKLITGTIMALGNFDGVHLGHRFIIEEAVRQARSKGKKSSVLLLDPHPLQGLGIEKGSFFLSTTPDKCTIFNSMDLDTVIIEEFTKSFASLSPESFVRDYLVGKYQVSGVVVGFNYSFGCRGAGKTSDLVRFGKEYGFSVTVKEAYTYKGVIVSSSLIRERLLSGDVEEAAALLGYPYHVKGKVVNGSKRGRTMGFPTANLDISPEILLPKKGVYLTKTRYLGQTLFALTNVGFKPTFSGETLSVEIHLLDFSNNLYGEELSVEFLHRMRDERPFTSTKELKEQIIKDINQGETIIRDKY